MSLSHSDDWWGQELLFFSFFLAPLSGRLLFIGFFPFLLRRKICFSFPLLVEGRLTVLGLSSLRKLPFLPSVRLPLSFFPRRTFKASVLPFFFSSLRGAGRQASIFFFSPGLSSLLNERRRPLFLFFGAGMTKLCVSLATEDS